MRVIKLKMLHRHHLALKVKAAQRGVSLAKTIRDIIDSYPDVPETDPLEEIQYTTIALGDEHIAKLKRIARILRSDVSGALGFMLDNKR